MANQTIQLFILNLTLTLRCTLKCKLCVADIMKYEKRPHFSTDYLIQSLDKAFQIVDRVERMQLSGGEPLLHEDIAQILDKTMEYQDRFGNLGIFLNGTVTLSDALIDSIQKYDPAKFMFYISHYGKHSPKVDDIVAQLEQHHLNYAVKKYHGENQHMQGWVDYGDYELQDYSEQQLEQIFQNCGVCQMGGIWSVRFGEIHRCTRSASGMSLGKIPRVPEDYIDLFDANKTIEEQRAKMTRLIHQSYITACKYCPGDFGTTDVTKRHPAGEQMEL